MTDTVEKKSDDSWMQKQWRPAMGWMYMLICLLDMAVFPVLWALLQALTHQPITQWNPLTLQGAGLFHIAMGAVLGIAAFGRTQEKLAGAATNAPSTTAVPTGMPATSGFPSAAPAPSAFSAPTPINTTAPKPIASGFGSGFGGGLDPSDPPTRNTRNDG